LARALPARPSPDDICAATVDAYLKWAPEREGERERVREREREREREKQRDFLGPS
jgi:hypothetical protein